MCADPKMRETLLRELRGELAARRGMKGRARSLAHPALLAALPAACLPSLFWRRYEQVFYTVQEAG